VKKKRPRSEERGSDLPYGAPPAAKTDWTASALFRPARRGLEPREAVDDMQLHEDKRLREAEGALFSGRVREVACLLSSHPAQQQRGAGSQEAVIVLGLLGRKSFSCPYLADLALGSTSPEVSTEGL
jgi:hypothetical protein